MQIDFPTKRNSVRPAVFAVTLRAATVIDWRHWTPLGDIRDSNYRDLEFKIFINDSLEFFQTISSKPITFVRHLDQSKHTKIEFCASGVEFLTTQEQSEIRRCIILQTITVEQYSLINYLTSNQDAQDKPKHTPDFGWPSTHCDSFRDPVILTENGCVSFVIGAPVYQWLLDIDPD